MTCVAGYVDTNGDIYMGGDSIGVNGGEYTLIKDSKVFIKRNMIFSFSTSFRMGNILKYDFEIPNHPPNLSTMEYLISIFLVKLLVKYEERRYLTISDNVAFSEVFLLGYDNRLFKIEPDLCIIEDEKKYDAAGCGQSFAKATFFNLKDYNTTPEEKVYQALYVASQFSLVRQPFTILKLPFDSGLNILDSKNIS